MGESKPTVGVLALQGDFIEHVSVLQRLGVPTCEVRNVAQLAQTDGLIVPGGESTTMATLLDAYAMRDPLIDYAREGHPVWGTCAGLILLANRLAEDRPTPLGLMDMKVHRNGFGRQVNSFETDMDIVGVQGGPFHAVFIRAPVIEQVGDAVTVMAQTASGAIVAARQGRLMATAFHPELTDDARLHAYFVSMIEGR